MLGLPEKIYSIDITYYVACWVGAIALYFKLKSEGKAVTEFLPHIFGDKAVHPMAKLVDAILFALVGSFIGTILTAPTSAQQAIAAGLGWTGLLSAFTRENSLREDSIATADAE